MSYTVVAEVCKFMRGEDFSFFCRVVGTCDKCSNIQLLVCFSCTCHGVEVKSPLQLSFILYDQGLVQVCSSRSFCFVQALVATVYTDTPYDSLKSCKKQSTVEIVPRIGNCIRTGMYLVYSRFTNTKT